MGMGKKRNSRPPKTLNGVRKLGPGAAAAREEGPRLIPLGNVAETPRLQHYWELADTALRHSRRKAANVKGHSASKTD